ncbi:MAG: acyl-CoA dehydrogenase [Bacillaceae bacterium]|jgi:Acyl-CoA dehydrogenases|uniref:Acyl-CoA dehydrogenase n=2 Tax=Aeribacillus TaxID=1055323 RepID=A0A165WHJ8_9BACI|nr:MULTISPECIES: acyl-CoA dehydrogenase family protein [Aeribacillus]REJ15154.1 MAG: acyl-CoA dehydrogenase [Bacillaceae bacterium]KZN94983.1 acyl-CoA dehydrogenase [Aeribacillus pallidus]MDR9792109.1 acyl-CoA dehydrogenase family protein [Aeribacillus pallidus]MED0703151.1 acyl-CoA/acyl-ACP dehydrogenase [Aeribacillus composti]MED0714224.1 acyl-CoA/acyl-ACP dehydrogenase [Aeribacillus composti]
MVVNQTELQEEIMQIPKWWSYPEGFEKLIEKAHELGKKELLPRASISDKECRYPRESLQAIADAGFGAVTIPVDDGGLGAGLTGFALLAESFSQYCASTTMCWVMHTAAVQTLYTAGTREQRQRYIPGVLKGKIGALAFSEPATGSHFWNVVSSAPRKGNGYLLNAEKSFVTSAGEADWYIVCTNYPNSIEDDPLMFLIVDHNQKGIEYFPFSAMGLRGNSSGPMKFKDVFVPIENRLGTEGGMNVYNENVIDPLFLLGTSACWVGIAQGALNAAIDQAKKKVHKDTGKSVAGYQVIRHELAKAQILIDSARSMLYRTAEGMDQCLNSGKELSECLYPLWELKTHAADIVIQVTNQALQVSGGRGYLTGQVEKFLRDGRAGAVMGPTNEILREWIGRTLIGVPWFE